MRDPARGALDDVSDHLGEVLRRADRLLADWSAFGAKVRDQVDREARTVGLAVASSVDSAVRGVADKAIGEQIEARLSALTVELGKLEQRSRAAMRALELERGSQRRTGWLALVALVGIAVANVLLVRLLLRDAPVQAPLVVPAPALQLPVDAGVPLASPIDASAVDAEVAIDAAPAAVPARDAAAPAVDEKPSAKRGTLPPRRK